MFDHAEIGLALLHGCGALALVSLCFGQIERLRVWPAVQHILRGCLFGFGASVAMHSAAQVMPGYYVDTRSVFIGFAGAFGGWPAALITLAFALVSRVAKGGAGVYIALATMPIAAMVGLLWRRLLGKGQTARVPSLAALGLAISCSALLSPFFMPLSGLALYGSTIAMLLCTNVLASVTLGSFIERERRLIHRESLLELEARFDGLTGLSNRKSFEDFAAVCLAGASRSSPVSLLVLDLDHFKDVNDRYGHAFGDEVLKATADVLRAVSHDARAGRLGGEEFGMLIMGGTAPAIAIANAIRTKLDDSRLLFGQTPVHVTASIGVSTIEKPAKFADIYGQSDHALYAAKRLGRNRVMAKNVMDVAA